MNTEEAWNAQTYIYFCWLGYKLNTQTFESIPHKL